MPRLKFASVATVALLISTSGALAQDAQSPITSVMQVPLEKSRQAINVCREKRLRGEISSYAESARCSNPQIFEAWKAANYPHMDLITEWLNAREAASEKLDQRIITPEEFEREMDELTVRLTAEEQRRHAGLLASPDNSLRLQLPPPVQVVPAAAPPREQKPAAKRSAAPRTQAVNEYVDPTPGTRVGSMGLLSQVDPPKPPTGGAGQHVPLTPNSPTARVAAAHTEIAAAHTEPGEGGNSVYALLASQQKEVDARAIYRMLQEKYPNILGKRNAVIRRTDIGGHGTYYRVEVGPLTSGQADELCGSLIRVGAQCTQRYD
jgi:hypothetical protein